MEDKPGFLPYGAGPRACPGAGLADMNMFLILVNLVSSPKLTSPLTCSPGDHLHPLPAGGGLGGAGHAVRGRHRGAEEPHALQDRLPAQELGWGGVRRR